MADHTPTLGFLLHDVARLLRKRFEQNARGSGLTRSQWQVLAYLERNQGIHQGGLADLLDIEPITLTRIVDKLEALGLLGRYPHPSDRRMRLLRLTPGAHDKLIQMHKLGEKTRAEALVGLSEADRSQLMASLQILKTNLADAYEAPAMKRASNG